jgi:hypothetical protein
MPHRICTTTTQDLIHPLAPHPLCLLTPLQMFMFGGSNEDVVLAADEAGYTACKGGEVKAKSPEPGYNFEPTEAGTFYFYSTINCSQGLKLQINVAGSGMSPLSQQPLPPLLLEPATVVATGLCFHPLMVCLHILYSMGSCSALLGVQAEPPLPAESPPSPRPPSMHNCRGKSREYHPSPTTGRPEGMCAAHLYAYVLGGWRLGSMRGYTGRYL